jgi:hypothetical protein
VCVCRRLPVSNECFSALNKINPVARAVVDTQFGNAFTDRFQIAGVSKGQATNADINLCACLPISQSGKPIRVSACLSDFDRDRIVSHRILFTSIIVRVGYKIFGAL